MKGEVKLEIRRFKFLHLLVMFFASIIVFLVISIPTQINDLTYILQFFIGSLLGYRTKQPLKRLIIQAVLLSLILILASLLIESFILKYSVVSILGIFFGIMLGKKLGE